MFFAIWFDHKISTPARQSPVNCVNFEIGIEGHSSSTTVPGPNKFPSGACSKQAQKTL